MTKLLYAVGLEPIEDLTDKLRAGFYRRLDSNETTRTLAMQFLNEERNRKNKTRTFATELSTFLEKYSQANLQFGSIHTKHTFSQIQHQIWQQRQNEMTNCDQEVVRLIGNGEWRERIEVIEANERLKEILSAFEHTSNKADTAFISLEETFLYECESE